MGDEGDIWNEHKAFVKQKKANNEQQSIELLRRHGIDFKVLNPAVRHYRVGPFDFWPSTGKFYDQRTGVTGRGIFNLIKIIKGNYGKS